MSLDKTSYNGMAWDKSKARNQTYQSVKNIEVQFEEAGEDSRRAVQDQWQDDCINKENKSFTRNNSFSMPLQDLAYFAAPVEN